jgi:hypothetical protein
VFIAKARPKPPFGNPRAFQPPKRNIIIFLVFLFYIDSHSTYIFDALSLIIESSAAMSAQLPRPSASAGAAVSGRAASRGKLAEASQRLREQAILLARVD